MHRDPSLRKRKALVIPGVLLVVLALVGMAYAQFVRPDTVECDEGRLVVLGGACRSAVLMLAIPLVIGLVLAIVGARVRTSTCHLGHGTLASTGLALLVAITALPLLGALAVYLMQDPDNPYVVEAYGLAIGQARLLAAAGLLLFVGMLLPYLLLYLGTSRPRRCCREKNCFEPCFCDEPLPEAPATVVVEQVQVQAWPQAASQQANLPPLQRESSPASTPAATPQGSSTAAAEPAREASASAPAPVVDDWASTPPADGPAKSKPKKKAKATRKVSTKKKA